MQNFSPSPAEDVVGITADISQRKKKAELLLSPSGHILPKAAKFHTLFCKKKKLPEGSSFQPILLEPFVFLHRQMEPRQPKF